MLRILVLLSYYNRPKLVLRALHSVLAAGGKYPHWELVFGDDSSLIPGRPIAEKVLSGCLEKVRFIHTGMSLEDKLRDGLRIGTFANKAIQESSADVGVILCDDDELHPDYFWKLANYFNSYPEILYCYSMIHVFNPLTQTANKVENLDHKYNSWNKPIAPMGKVDASQVAWRLACCKNHDAWFPETTKFECEKPWLIDTDKSFFENLYKKCGPCHPTGFVAQYKGVHDYQLLWHKNLTKEALRNYDRLCCELGGVVL